MKKILFYSQVCYLDVAIEYIKLLSNANYEVYVLIELPNSQLKSNILDLDVNLDNYNSLTSFKKVGEKWGLDYLKPYFEKCASVEFVVHKSNSLLSTFSVSKDVSSYINSINPSYIHLDDISARHLFILPFLIKNKKKLVLNIHDPKQHLGEFEWKRFILKKIFYKITSRFIVYSVYSEKQLKTLLADEKLVFTLRLLPYTVYNNFIVKNDLLIENRPISFIGRISPYKGIELFLEVIKELEIETPSLNFIIAGKPVEGFDFDSKNIVTSSNNIKILEKHLSNEEITEIIINSQIIVCPYLEASQSGVIMTALALNRPVLVSNVGALPEYILNNETGLILEQLTKDALKIALIDFVKDMRFHDLVTNIKKKNILKADAANNLIVINEVYSHNNISFVK